MRRWITAVLVLAAVSAAAYGDDAHVRYLAVFMNDTKVGHLRSARRVEGDRVIHEEHLSMSVQRFGVTMPIRIDDRYVETAAGEPVEFASTLQAGPLGRTVRRGRIEDGTLHLTVEEAGSSRERILPFPDGALFPEGVRLRRLAEGLKAGTTYEMAIWDPQSVDALAVKVTVGPTAPTMLIGRSVPATEIVNRVSTSMGTMEIVEHVDAGGTVLRSTLPVMGMQLRLVACDQAFATAPSESFELRDAATVASPRPLPAARQSVRATYTLKPAEGVSLILPDTGEQTVRTQSDAAVVVRVALATPGKATRPYEGDAADVRAMLDAGEHVQSDHPKITARAEAIVGEIADAGAAAKAIEAWVGNHIADKSLSVAYASALATLTSGEGDCTEHAVLTAALCRAAGIPCRVVMGVAYTDAFEGRQHCFIAHAWNQAYVGGRWVTLDAALGADAGRIALGVGNGDPLDFIGLTQSLGRFTITAATVRATAE
ncbi:MAG: transglutaminase-like domain-containing protein [Planctomycetota bacterium]